MSWDLDDPHAEFKAARRRNARILLGEVADCIWDAWAAFYRAGLRGAELNQDMARGIAKIEEAASLTSDFRSRQTRDGTAE